MPGNAAGDTSDDAILRELAAAPGVQPDLLLPEIFSADVVVAERYDVRRRLGAGGMGAVYLAWDRVLAREVALKLTRGTVRERDVARLRREAQAMGSLNHPHVLDVYDFGTASGAIYIAMEYAPGGTLTQALSRGPSHATIIDWFLAAGEGLAAAHAMGIVHRDFKPDNVLMSEDGIPKVGDFGLAAPHATTDRPSPSVPSRRSTDRLTRTGASVGTPAYMAPEQWSGDPVDARADQYAFCLALFEALHGSRPEQAGPEPITLPPHRLPRRLAKVILTGIRTDPKERWASMGDLLAALRRATRPRLWPAAAALVVAAGAFALTGGEATECKDALQLDGIWDPQVRARASASFSRSELEFATVTWEQTAAHLDAYAGTLADAWADACRDAGQPRADRRLSCLRKRRSDLGALTRMLARKPDASVLGAMEASRALRPVATCVDRDAQSPADDAHNGDGAAAREFLAAARVLTSAGHHAEARTLAEHAAAAAKRSGEVGLHAEALLEHGRALAEGARDDEACEVLEAAYFAALEANDERVAAMAATTIVQNAHGRLDLALRWHAVAHAAAARLGDATIGALRRCRPGQHVRIERGVGTGERVLRSRGDGAGSGGGSDPAFPNPGVPRRAASSLRRRRRR